MGENRSTLTKLRGLPYDVIEDEISTFFQGFETTLIHICRRDGAPCALPSSEEVTERAMGSDVGCVTGRATGEAYVEFKTAAIAEEAVQARNNQNLRHRYLE